MSLEFEVLDYRGQKTFMSRSAYRLAAIPAAFAVSDEKKEGVGLQVTRKGQTFKGAIVWKDGVPHFELPKLAIQNVVELTADSFDYRDQLMIHCECPLFEARMQSFLSGRPVPAVIRFPHNENRQAA